METQKEKLLKLVHEAIEHDNQLRAHYKIGDKFRFIRDRLRALLSYVEESLVELEKETKQTTSELTAEEVLVHVYLYNAQGLIMQTWQKMLNPAVFYEYSVNRPIYREKSQIEAFIRSKTNKTQHGYLTVAVNKQFILNEAIELKDPIGNPLIKVKEGSLKAEKLQSFTHNNNEFVLNEKGELVKKEH